MHKKFLGFVATLTPIPELVKRFRETVESVFFRLLVGNVEDKTHLVALMGIEPMFQP
jgi:hypothetical protein